MVVTVRLASSGFFHVKVAIGKAGNLRQVGDAQHLGIASQPLQALAHALRHAAADTRVNLIKDKGNIAPPGAACPAAHSGLPHDRFQSQHQPRDFAARGNFFHHPQVFPDVG